MLDVPSWPIGFICCVVSINCVIWSSTAVVPLLCIYQGSQTCSGFQGWNAVTAGGVHEYEICPVLELGCKELCIPQQLHMSTGALNWDTWVMNTFPQENCVRQWGTIKLLQLFLWMLFSIKPSQKIGEKSCLGSEKKLCLWRIVVLWSLFGCLHGVYFQWLATPQFLPRSPQNIVSPRIRVGLNNHLFCCWVGSLARSAQILLYALWIKYLPGSGHEARRSWAT